jgi:hypothetical protein
MTYVALLFFFIGIELIYFKIADKYNIIDKPNSRSSHTATLRGGELFSNCTNYGLAGYVPWDSSSPTCSHS